MTMRVEPGGLRAYYRVVSGFVTDSQDRTRLSGVIVRILDGSNAGRTSTTGADGTYQLYDLQPGTFTMRFSKSGYLTADRIFVLTGDKLSGLDVSLERSSS